MTKDEKIDLACDILGFPGKRLSGSKSTPNIVYNANVCIYDDGKLWHGDFHRINDLPKLLELATKLDTPMFVLREMDARFENEELPKIERATITIEPNKPRY